MNNITKFNAYKESGIYDEDQLAIIYHCILENLDETKVADRLYNDHELSMLFWGINEEEQSKIQIYFNKYQMWVIYHAMMLNKEHKNDPNWVDINIKIFGSHWFTYEQMMAVLMGQVVGVDWHLYCVREYKPEKMLKIINTELNKSGRDFKVSLEDLQKNIDTKVDTMKLLVPIYEK